MKLSLALLGLLSFSAFAQNLTLRDYNYTLNDVLSRRVNKETLFQNMNRDFIKTGSSICSNRALMWDNDFKRFYGIDSAKVFMFYTGKNGRTGSKTWWYHVTPVINEGGKLWTMDAGFPGMVDGPMPIGDWFQEFAGTRNCKEITPNETGLIERMFITQVFPQYTEYGSADCYYHIAPAAYWTPESVAMGLLGRDSQGNPVNFYRDRIDQDELMQACMEASTSRFGRVFGNNKKKCEQYIYNGRYPRN